MVLTAKLIGVDLSQFMQSWLVKCSSVLLCWIVLANPVVLAGAGLQERLYMLSDRIDNAPTSPSLYLRRALIYSDIGEFKLAFTDVDMAAQYGPIENTHFVRGILFYRLGQFDQAVALFDQFIEANPNHAEALRYRGRVLRDAGQDAAALADFRRYIQLVPNAEPGDYVATAKLMMAMPDFSADEVLEFLDRRVAALDYAPQLQKVGINIEQQRCSSAAVVQRLQRVHASSQRTPQWHLQMAEQQWLLNQTDSAQRYLQLADEVLQQRRPSAIKAELQHRQAFLATIINANSQSSETVEAVHKQFYPMASEANGHSHTHNSEHHHHQHAEQEPSDDNSEHVHHTHDSGLSDLSQPQVANTGYQTDWAKPVAPFYACLQQQLAAE